MHSDFEVVLRWTMLRNIVGNRIGFINKRSRVPWVGHRKWRMQMLFLRAREAQNVVSFSDLGTSFLHCYFNWRKANILQQRNIRSFVGEFCLKRCKSVLNEWMVWDKEQQQLVLYSHHHQTALHTICRVVYVCSTTSRSGSYISSGSNNSWRIQGIESSAWFFAIYIANFYNFCCRPSLYAPSRREIHPLGPH